MNSEREESPHDQAPQATPQERTMKPSIEDLRREAERCTGGGTAIIIHAIINRLAAMEKGEGDTDAMVNRAAIAELKADVDRLTTERDSRGADLVMLQKMLAEVQRDNQRLERERDEARAKLERPDRSLYTDRLRKACELAKQEATNMGHKYIGTEHMLLGLMREGSGVAANVLKNMGIDPVRVAADTLDLVGGTKVAEQAKPATSGRAQVLHPEDQYKPVAVAKPDAGDEKAAEKYADATDYHWQGQVDAFLAGCRHARGSK